MDVAAVKRLALYFNNYILSVRQRDETMATFGKFSDSCEMGFMRTYVIWASRFLVASACGSSVIACSEKRIAASSPILFHCEGGASFLVSSANGGVSIVLPGRTVHMLAKPSNLGKRYVSDEGTLIIDDDFASLVLSDDLKYQACSMTPAQQSGAGRAWP